MSKREINSIPATTEIECLVMDAKAAKALIKETEKKLKKIEVSICSFMKDKEDLVDEDGIVIVTWVQPADTKRFDLARFKEEQGALYEAYIIEKPNDRRFCLK